MWVAYQVAMEIPRFDYQPNITYIKKCLTVKVCWQEFYECDLWGEIM
jgi:hypothetical protein